MSDETHDWPTGASFSDLAARIRQYSEANGTPATEVRPYACEDCGGPALGLHVDDEEGVAGWSCGACGSNGFLADSGEYWEEAEPTAAACPCGHEVFELGLGFSVGDDGEVRWVFVGARCLRCGIVGVYADWNIDYTPSGHLLQVP